MRLYPMTAGLLLALLAPGLALGQSREERSADSLKDTTAEESPQDAGEQIQALAPVERRIVERTNRFRQKKDLQPLSLDKRLLETARYFASYMAQNSKYGHTADGQRPSERADNHGYEYCLVSENIAWRYSSTGFDEKELARGFFRGWKKSKEHRKNMLDEAATETGVAVAQSDSGRYYAVQMFGRPRSEQYTFEVANRSEGSVRYTVADRSFELPPRFTRTHQRCRRVELTLSPESESGEKTYRPDGGETFVIQDSTDGLEVTVQAKKANASTGQ